MPISSAIDSSAVARILGISVNFRDLRRGNIVYLPQRIAVVGQGADAVIYSGDKQQFTSAFAVGQAYGFGSPLHLVAKQLFPVNGDGVGTLPVTFYPLQPDGAGVAAAGSVTPSGTATRAASYRVSVNGVLSNQFVIDDTDDVASMLVSIIDAVNAVVDMPVIASNDTTEVGLTAKWSGVTGNDLHVEVLGPTDAGVSFAVSQPSGGLANPDVQPALDQFGNVWETMVLNCLDIADTVALDAYATFGEGRWGATNRKPLVVFTGNTATTVSAATAVTDARTADRVDSQLVAPGSKALPFAVAARQLARIARVANNNPPRDYGSQKATGIAPGPDGDQWDYPQRDQAVKAGSSTIEVKDGVINLSDIVTMYHPEGDPLPAYRYVVDIVKLQNILFNLDLIFATDEWDGAPLIPDDQPTTNRSAKKPNMAVAAVASLIDALANEAIISDPETAKASIVAEIDSANPKRLNLAFTVQLSGNTNIISVDFNFGFYFGAQPTAA